MTTVLIVEDDIAIREMIVASLSAAEFVVLEAADADTALIRLGDRLADLILVDWMLPGQSGIEFVRRLKRDSAMREIPLIMLTAKGEEYDKFRGFEAGVDDYVSKPFSTRELIARIHAVLRRVQVHGGDQPIRLGALCLDPAGHRVSVGSEAIKLGPTEFKLLNFFMTHPERLFDRSQLLDRVWGRNVYIEERTVDVHIRRLRKALSPHGYQGHIQTVHGSGYRFSEQAQT